MWTSRLATKIILDLVITSSDSSLAPSLTTTLFIPSDHFLIFTKLSVVPTSLPPSTYHSFRRLHSIDAYLLLSDLQPSSLITSPPASISSFLSSYDATFSSLLDKYAPVIIKFSKRSTKSNPWFSSTLHTFRSTVPRAENLYKRTHSALSFPSFTSHRNRYHKLILSSKKKYYSNVVSSSSDNPRRLWKTVNKLLHRESASFLPSSASSSSLANSFASFFTDKIHKIRSPAHPWLPSPLFFLLTHLHHQ